MKRLLYLTMVASLLTFSCQKATLIEEDEDEFKGGRTSTEETVSDSTTVTPEFTGEGWDEPIDVNFGFGGDDND